MTRYNPDIHHRHSIRLREYDYSEAGAYFVTVCTQNRECLFGEMVDSKVILNDARRMVESIWNELHQHYKGVETDEFVVMPNHFHGIIVLENYEIVNNVGARFIAPKTRSIIDPDINIGERPQKGVINYAPTLGQIIRYFKGKASFVGRKELPHFQWQRNYYEHIIRDENELNRLREYMINNPAQWSFDNENPDCDTVGAGPCACPIKRKSREEGQPRGVAPTKDF
jgi:putative transposase